MKDHVFGNMLQRLSNLFGEPKTNNTETKEQYLEEYSKQLEEFSSEELQYATDQLVNRYQYKTWPTVAECIMAAQVARKKLNATGDGVPMADVPGTGWRLDQNGKKWFRIQSGSNEFMTWMKYLRQNGQGQYADYIRTKAHYTFVPGPDPVVSGKIHLAYLASGNTKSKSKGVYA